MRSVLVCLGLSFLLAAAAKGGEEREEGTALTVYRESNEVQQARGSGGQYYDSMTGQYVMPIPGWAVVKVRRKLALKEGLNIVRFQDVASAIDATTVLVTSLTDPKNTSVAEQNYEYDLVNSNKIMQKYIDRPVAALTEGGEVRGDLLSFDAGNLILKTEDNAHPLRVLARGQNVRELRFSALPEGLITRPTLVWHLNAKKAGDHILQATYHANQIGWKADYTATLSADETTLDLSAWVTMNNRSGATYSDAKLKLIAGDIHRVLTPQQRAQMQQYATNESARLSSKPHFEEKSFFEYHLYTLERPVTLADNSEKQIELFPPVSAIPFNKHLVYYGGRGMYNYQRYGGQPNQDRNFGTTTNTKVDIYLEFKNEKQSGLGIPLPAGRVRVYKRDPEDKAMEFVGEDEVDHTPKDEELRLRMGSAFDVTAERRQTAFDARYNEHILTESFEIKVRNHKKEDIKVDVQEDMYRWINWEITESTQKHDKFTSQRAIFPLKVKKNGETVLTYTVRYTW